MFVRLAVTAAALATAIPSPDALAQSPPLAQEDVREMRSASFGDHTVRAFLGKSNTDAFLALDSVSTTPVAPLSVRQLTAGKTKIPADSLKQIDSILLQSDRTVVVRLDTTTSRLECRTQLKERRFTRLQCNEVRQGEGTVAAGTQRQQTQHYQPMAVDWSQHSGVVKLCEEEFAGVENERICLRAARRATRDPRRSIRLCVETMGGDEDELRCIANAVQASGAGPDLIKACVDTINGDNDEARCIEEGKKAHSLGPAIVRACGETMLADLNELTCVTWSATHGANGLEAIKGCAKMMKEDKERLACIGAAVRSGFAPGNMIAACDRMTTEEMHALACVQMGARAESDPSAIVTSCHDTKADVGARINCVGDNVDKRIERAIRSRSRRTQ